MQEQQRTTAWQSEDSHRPEIAFDAVSVLWLVLPGGTIKQMWQCNDGEVRLFFSRAITNHYKGKCAENARRDLLDTIDVLDRYATWWLVCELIARCIPLALYQSRDDALHGRNPLRKKKDEAKKRIRTRRHVVDASLVLSETYVRRVVESSGYAFSIDRTTPHLRYYAIRYATSYHRRQRIYLASTRTIRYTNEQQLRTKLEEKAQLR